MDWFFYSIGFAVLLLAIGRNRWSVLERRMSQIEQRLKALEAIAAKEAMPATEPEPAPVIAPVPEQQQPSPNEPEPAIAATPAPASPVPPRRSLEEIVGTSWSVWVGGIALALGALLLVRYSIESGFFGPGFRVIAGLLLAAGLATAGEWLRRKQGPTATPPVDGQQPAYIPGVLTGAAAVAAFGALYAAYALYDFIGPGFAMIALGATGIACLYAAALHGPALAGIGLLASFVTPLLVSTDEPNRWALAIYLGAISAANHAFARYRRWLWLALMTAIAGGLWALAFIFITEGTPSGFAPALMHLMVITALTAYVIGIGPYRGLGENAHLDRTSHIALAIYAFLGLAQIGSWHRLESAGWIIGALALTGVFVAAGMAGAALRGALALAGALLVGALWAWPDLKIELDNAIRYLSPEQWRSLEDAGRFLGFAALAPLALAALCGWRLFRGPAFNRVGTWIVAGTATLTPLAALASAYVRVRQLDSGSGFAVAAAALATIFVAVATLARKGLDASGEADANSRSNFILGAAASACLAALAQAFVFALDGGTLTVALALAALGAAYIAMRLDIPALRWCVAALGLAVAVRLAVEPRIVGAALGTNPVFNWLLFGYGIPAAAFGWASRLMRAGGTEDTPVRIAQSLAVLLSGFLVFFEIRHALNAGDIYAYRHGMVEQGLQTFSALGFATVLTRLDAARANPVFRFASLAFGALSFTIAALGLGISSNPLMTNESIQGGAAFNTLLLGYALPALAALVLARAAAGLRPDWYVSGARIATIALTFAFLSLEVRHLWLGENIGVMHGMGQGELYTYSAVWLAFGGLLLVYGLWRQSREARLASAGFVLLTVLKVFLIDLAHLEGLLRAVSFLALGAALIVIGLVYQRYVFARPAPPPAGAQSPEGMV